MLTILQGDWVEQLRTLPDASVNCCVTSPPYWGLRDYGVAGQLGLEKTPEEYVAKLVAGFREVRRVLRDDGTVWVNLGDSYARSGGSGDGGEGRELAHMGGTQKRMCKISKANGAPNGALRSSVHSSTSPDAAMGAPNGSLTTQPGQLKPKDMVGIPWRAAFALQADGWYLRSDIIWAKPNPMPESVTDRPTKAHEYIFLLSKSQRYYYDAEAIKESQSSNGNGGFTNKETCKWRAGAGANGKPLTSLVNATNDGFRNRRTVWTVATSPYPESHFATFPPDLIKPCILAGCPVGGTVLDPFGGSGTTGQVAIELGRKAVLIELNPAYVALIRQRCAVTPGLGI